MTITFYNWTVLPPIFTGMYECFSLVFFSSAGSNMLQKETTKFSLGHPVRRIKHHVISFFGGFVKNSFYVPPLPMSLKELCDRITHALQTIIADMLHRVWDEFDYRVDVCHVSQGAHIEGLWLTHEKLGELPLLTYVVPV